MAVPRWLFIVLSLLWLPAGVAATAPLRGFGFGADPAPWPMVVLMMASSLVVVAPAGLPLPWRAGDCVGWGMPVRPGPRSRCWRRRPWRYPCSRGCLGPLAIAVAAAVLSVPVWFAVGVLRRRG